MFGINWDAAFLLKGCSQKAEAATHVVVESLGLTGVFTRVSSLWSCTVQVPENTTTHGKKQAGRGMMQNDRSSAG